MTQAQAEFLMAVARHEDIDASMNPHYSGRGMYGKTTFAVTVHCPTELLTAAFNLVVSEEHFRQRAPHLTAFASDSMGYDRVIY